jgi:hypothetical protein
MADTNTEIFKIYRSALMKSSAVCTSLNTKCRAESKAPAIKIPVNAHKTVEWRRKGGGLVFQRIRGFNKKPRSCGVEY